MTLPYDTGFPTTNDSLGSTRAKFFGNTQSVKDLININHYDFGNVLYGNHKWVWYGRLSSTFPDTSTPANDAIATYNATDGVRSQLWFQPSNDATGANAIQLTAGDVTNATFSTNTTYETTHDGGWTFLPGEMLLQYGTVNDSPIPATGSVNFPIPFSVAPFSLVFGISRASGSSSAQNFYYDTLTSTSFNYSNSSNNNRPVSWMAIGKA